MITGICISLVAYLSVLQYRAQVGSHFSKSNQAWLELNEVVQTVLMYAMYLVIAVPALVYLHRFFSPSLTYGDAAELLSAVPLVALLWQHVISEVVLDSRTHVPQWAVVGVFVACVGTAMYAIAHILSAESQATITSCDLLAIGCVALIQLADFAAGWASFPTTRKLARLAARCGYGKSEALRFISEAERLIGDLRDLEWMEVEYWRCNVRQILFTSEGEVQLAFHKGALHDWSHAAYIARETCYRLRRVRRALHESERCDLRSLDGTCDCYTSH